MGQQVTERTWAINVAQHYQNLDFLLFPAIYPATSGDYMHFNGDPMHCLSSVDNGATGIDYKYAALGSRSSQASPFNFFFSANFAPLPNIEIGGTLVSVTSHFVASVSSGGLAMQSEAPNGLSFGRLACTADGTFHDNSFTVQGSIYSAANMMAVLRMLKRGQYVCVATEDVSSAAGLGTVDAAWLDVTYVNP